MQPPSYSVTVNDTNPIFFYCSAPDSCTAHGMVGVINPNATTSLARQRSLAQEASYELSPGQTFPSEAETPSSSLLPDGTKPSSSSTSHGHKPSAGAIAGISIACVSVVVLGVLLAWFWGRLKSLSDEVLRKNSTVVRSTEPRNTWYLTASPSSREDSSSPWATPNVSTPATMPSPPLMPMHTQSPMSTHAVPPSYYESQYATRGSASASASGAAAVDRSPGGIARAASHRSVGGTFTYSPVTGRYSRAYDHPEEEEERFEHRNLPLTSDMTSPVDPGLRQNVGGLADLVRLLR